MILVYQLILIKLVKVDDINIKNYCLQNIYIKYDAANVYELSYVLLDKKLSIKELLGKCNSEVEGYNKLYEFETFNILQCKENNDMIIGPKTLDVDSNFCPKDNLINPNEVKTEE